jgi:hypothetical protein
MEKCLMHLPYLMTENNRFNKYIVFYCRYSKQTNTFCLWKVVPKCQCAVTLTSLSKSWSSTVLIWVIFRNPRLQVCWYIQRLRTTLTSQITIWMADLPTVLYQWQTYWRMRYHAWITQVRQTQSNAAVTPIYLYKCLAHSI